MRILTSVLTHANRISRSEVFYKKRCSETFVKILRKKPVLESSFNKVEGLHPANLSKEDCSTDFFLWISEHLFFKKLTGHYFSIKHFKIFEGMIPEEEAVFLVGPKLNITLIQHRENLLDKMKRNIPELRTKKLVK